VTEIVSQIPEQLRTCEVCLRSQGENRANEPLWERRGEFLFEPFTDENGVLYSAARVTFNNVPIGWAELMIKAEAYRKMTMKVFVTPDIWCKHDDEKNRWYLLPPREELIRVTELTGEPRRVVEQITRQIPRQDGVFHIDAALWKQCDDYFIIDMINGRPKRPSDRYVPSKIRGYNYGVNGPHFSVDAQVFFEDPETHEKYYCGPNNEDPRQEPPRAPILECQNTLPAHQSEPIGVIELDPLSPAEAFIDLDETDEALEVEEGENDNLCKD